MRIAVVAMITLASANVAFGQEKERPRLFVTDSQSWEVTGGFGGLGGGENAVAGNVSGGARPQTAEIIKTVGERCPDVIVTMNKETADYIILLDHEGGKGIIFRDNKFAVFNGVGDVIGSGSTRSLGNAVKDACSALMQDWQSRPAE